MVGVSDPIEEYLAQLRASLRTPPERTAEILAEAEDHLRESAAAGEALGLAERDAQEAAIRSFGPIRAVVRAHRRPAAAVLAEAGMAAWKIAAIYLLVMAGTAVLVFPVQYWLARAKPPVPGGSPPAGLTVAGLHDVPDVAVVLAGVLIAGLVLLTGYRRARRRSRQRHGRAPAALLGGYFPLVATICLLLLGPLGGALIVALAPPSHGFGVLAAAAMLGSLAAAIGYAVQVARTILRQGKARRVSARGADHA